jgi:hypothetical protein
MKNTLNLFLAGLMLAACVAIAPTAAAAPGYVQLVAPVEAGIDIPIELYWPSHAPRALVIVAPNSGGLADPYFDPELRQASYRPDHRGGLVEALGRQGYAVAFFSLRGYALLRDCAHGDQFAERAADFAAHCVNGQVRATASLASTTADTAAVFQTLARLPQARGLPQVALAFSEGMHHVSLLAGQGRIAPVGIVGVGGPTAALADLWAYQMQRDYYFQLAQRAFQRCPEAELDTGRLFDCAQAPASAVTRAGMEEFIGANTVSPVTLAARRQLVQTMFQQVQAHYAGDVGHEVMAGGFGGVQLPAVWSGLYYAQVFQARTSTVAQLGAYPGRTIYLVGEGDYLQPPAGGQCSAGMRCSVRTVPGVGHGLEDDSGFPPAHAMRAIIDAVNAVAFAPSGSPRR